jgi:hypothetical protein
LVRDIVVGGAGRVQAAMGNLAPRLVDKVMERGMFNSQKAFDRTQPREGNLDRPRPGGRARGVQRSYTMKSSAYTRAVLSPLMRVVPFAAAGLAMLAVKITGPRELWTVNRRL